MADTIVSAKTAAVSSGDERFGTPLNLQGQLNVQGAKNLANRSLRRRDEFEVQGTGFVD